MNWSAKGGANASGTPPAAPSQVAVGQDQTTPRTQINVYWQGNATNEIAYRIFRSEEGLTFTQIATVPASTYNEYLDGSLTPGAEHYYYVEACNSAGSSTPSNADSTVTPKEHRAGISSGKTCSSASLRRIWFISCAIRRFKYSPGQRD